MDLEHNEIKKNGIRLHVVRPNQKAEFPSCCCTASPNLGMDNHNPQKELVLTKRFIISPSKIAQNG
jgi:hypothetical protein